MIAVPVLLVVSPDADILCQKLVLGCVLVSAFLVEPICVAPFCRAVFLVLTVVPTCGEINTKRPLCCKQGGL